MELAQSFETPAPEEQIAREMVANLFVRAQKRGIQPWLTAKAFCDLMGRDMVPAIRDQGLLGLTQEKAFDKLNKLVSQQMEFLKKVNSPYVALFMLFTTATYICGQFAEQEAIATNVEVKSREEVPGDNDDKPPD